MPLRLLHVSDARQRDDLLSQLAFEFIENSFAEYVKQDCELKAWRRLYGRIVERFPRLRLNLTGDGLYAEETTMADIDRRAGNFMITLTDDRLPSVTAQLPAVRPPRPSPNPYSRPTAWSCRRARNPRSDEPARPAEAFIIPILQSWVGTFVQFHIHDNEAMVTIFWRTLYVCEERKWVV